jgi:hypothetical protein
MAIDFAVHNEGTVALLQPISGEAQRWVEENITPEHMTWGESVVVEPRYLGAILEGAVADGLVIAA